MRVERGNLVVTTMIRLTLRRSIKYILLVVFAMFVAFNLVALGGGFLHPSEVEMGAITSQNLNRLSQKTAVKDMRELKTKDMIFNTNFTLRNFTIINSTHNDEILPELNRSQILLQILEANRIQTIKNSHLLPKDFAQNADSVCIVIQIHTRYKYLQYLIDSLKRTRDIERSLVVFSHDYHSSVLNELVQSITAFPVSLTLIRWRRWCQNV